MIDVQIIDSPAAAAVAIDPVRNRLLAELALPASAANLAQRVEISRQKVNYHLHALEQHGLVQVAKERKWGGLTERLMVASAASYVLSPDVLGKVAIDPEMQKDRLSANYMLALATRVIREVGAMIQKAFRARKNLATLSVDTQIRFRNAQERAEFTAELVAAVHRLVARYHDERSPGGRPHRLIILAHPHTETTQQEHANANQETS